MQPVTYRLSGSKRILDVLSLGIFGCFFLALVITAGIGLRWLEIPGTEWIESYGAAQDIAFFWMYLGLTVMSGLLFAFITRWRSPVWNYLTLDDAGLTYAFMGMRRTWPWRDVESADVLNRPFGMNAARLIVSGKFGWKARLGMLLVNGFASPDRLAVLLPDFYEAPVKDIVATLTEYRDRAVGARQPDKFAIRTPPRTTATPGQPITYAKAKTRYSLEHAILVVLFVIVGLVMAPLAATVYLLIDERPDFGSVYGPLVLSLGLIAVSWPAVFLFEFWHNKPKHNFLALDGDGLTYMRRRLVYTWSWQVLSGFETKTAPTIIGRRFITFAAPGKDWTWWWLRLTSRLPGKPPAVVIEDIYDTPLDEIAATLNAHRERALGGANGPASPEQA